jgi:hypothetical protein
MITGLIQMHVINMLILNNPDSFGEAICKQNNGTTPMSIRNTWFAPTHSVTCLVAVIGRWHAMSCAAAHTLVICYKTARNIL